MKNARRLIILLAALLCWGAAYTLLFTSWGQRLSGFRCENFGCLGNGLLYFTFVGLCPVLFAILGAFVGKGARLTRALEAGLICLCVMIGATLINTAINQARIARAMAEACRETPELYPEQCRNAAPPQSQ